MDIQANQGASVVLVAKLMSGIPFMNGADKAFDGFMHIASLEELPSDNITKYYVDRNNKMTGDNFSYGCFERHCPPCQKPIPLPFIIHNSFVISRIIKAANDDGLPFSESNTENFEEGVMNAHSLVALRILCLLSLTGNIISNHYAIGADIPKKLATKVRDTGCIIGESLLRQTSTVTHLHNAACLVLLYIAAPREWLQNNEISSSTFHTGFRSDHSNMHPACVAREQGMHSDTREAQI
jgi:hypothetical protein